MAVAVLEKKSDTQKMNAYIMQNAKTDNEKKAMQGAFELNNGDFYKTIEFIETLNGIVIPKQ